MSGAQSVKPLILDVRTHAEFQEASVAGSLNLPLHQLADGVQNIERDQPIVVCCASGARSSMAKAILDGLGYCHVVNVGPWQSALHIVNH